VRRVAGNGDGGPAFSGLNGALRTRPAGPSVAIVGLGYWGPNLLRVLVERNDVHVSWVCDLDRSRLARFGRRYPGVRLTPNVDELLADPDLDAVMLATPVFSHYDLARRCLDAGKHTFVEKPLAHSSERAGELVELAAERGRVLTCGHTFLHSPPVRKVRELIAADELGEVYFVSASRVNLGLHQRDVGVVWDLGPHDFSILLYWLGGPPRSIRAIGRDSVVPGITDVAFVTLEFDSGVIATVELSWLAPSKLRRTVVVGSKQMVVYEDGCPEQVKIYDRGVEYKDPETFGEYHLSYRAGDVLSPRLSNDEPLALQTGEFVRAVRTGEPQPAHLELARDVVRLTEAADESLRAGGVPVELELLQRLG
jgi:predicted dehydrogenase